MLWLKHLSGKIYSTHNLMVTTPLVPDIEIIHLAEISWTTYEILLKELSDRRFRLTYNRSTLEIMTPSPEHELGKEVLGRFVETLAEVFEVSLYPLGSTTLKKPELSGAEPDKCFYIRNIETIRVKKRLDLTQDPAPDLIIEVDITNSSQNRLQVYADLKIAEVWIYNGESLLIQQLCGNRYTVSPSSQFFANLSLSKIGKFLQQAKTKDYLELVKEFRQWVKNQLNSPQ